MRTLIAGLIALSVLTGCSSARSTPPVPPTSAQAHTLAPMDTGGGGPTGGPGGG